MNARVLLIEPRDPVIFRDGRPFAPGLSARSLPFPMPATTIGAIRTRAGEGSGFDPDTVRDLLTIEQTGPFLAVRGWQADEEWKLLMPAPADCVPYAEGDGEDRSIELCPLRPAKTTGSTNLPKGLFPLLHSRIRPEDREGKVASNPPLYWHPVSFEDWLNHKSSQPILKSEEVLGYRSLAYDQRTHLEVQDHTQTAAEGMLFSTSGLVFQRAFKRDQGLEHLRHALISLVRNGACPVSS